MSEYDVSHDCPLGGLPPAEPVLLRNPQIEAALVEVRFAGVDRAVDSDVAFRIRDAAEESGYAFPQMQAAQTQELTVRVENGTARPEVHEQSSGWQLATDDGHLAITILPAAIAIQATKYERWRVTLEPVLDRVAAAVRDALAPSVLNRVGVRFINRLTQPGSEHPATWEDAIEPTFLGPILHRELGSRIVGSQQQVEIRLGPAKGALIRHGVFMGASPPGHYGYLVDVDVFDQTANPFNADNVVTVARVLDRTALTLFQQIVTAEYRATMNPYARVDETGTLIDTDQRSCKGTQ